MFRAVIRTLLALAALVVAFVWLVQPSQAGSTAAIDRRAWFGLFLLDAILLILTRGLSLAEGLEELIAHCSNHISC